MMACRLLIAVYLLLQTIFSPQQAAAQQKSTAQPAPVTQSSPEPPASPYEPDLLRLAEIMGSLAYLREICAGRDAPDWHDKMAALLEAEGRTTARRERLSEAYNRGFKAYASIHRVCRASTEEASLRLAADGERLAKRLADRFGG